MILTVVAGNICRDPELRTIKDGLSVTTLRIAANRKFGRDAIFINVSVFGKDAEHCCNYLSKGRSVRLSGELVPVRIYTTKSGETRADYEMEAERGSIEFGNKSDGEPVGGGRNVQQHQYRPNPNPTYGGGDNGGGSSSGSGNDDWMPF